MSDDLRERVAKAMWATPLDENCAPVSWEDASDEARNAYQMEADAAIAIIRNETLEEAARVAEAFPARTHGNLATAPYAAAEQAADEIAAAIRALKDKP